MKGNTMRTTLKVIFIVLIFIIGSIIKGIMKDVGIRGAIPKLALVWGMLAAMCAIWKYNPQKADEIANSPKLDKES